jgi:hypothetical protein
LRQKRNTTLFLIAVIYLASRVVLIFPDAIEKKAKRLIFFQEQYSSTVYKSQQRVEFKLNIYPKLPEDELLNSNSKKRVAHKSLQKFKPVVFYTGNRILASPGDPYDFSC